MATQFVQITRKARIPEDEFWPMITAMNKRLREQLYPPQPFLNDLTSTASQNIITLPDTPIPDCETCGACCTLFPAVAVRHGDDDLAGECWEITNGEVVVDRFVRRDGETLACTALTGTLGEHVGCRVYDQRPRTCREFEAGSDRCHAARRSYGLEPDLTLEEICEANRKLDARRFPPASEMVKNAKISAREGTAELEITVTIKDGRSETIHAFDPVRETWRQSEFDGLTMQQAREIVASRKPG